MEKCLIEIKDDLRRIPNYGRGYGLVGERKPEENISISFNYHGAVDAVSDNLGLSTGECIAQENELPWDLSFNGVIQEGCLSFSVLYNKKKFYKESIEKLVQEYKDALTEVKECCAGIEEPVRTATDFSSDDLTGENYSI